MLPIFFILIILSACQLTLQTPSPFSLQPAVDALSDREVQLALRDEIENENVGDFLGNDEFEWNNDYDLERGQHVPSKAMARYLARSNADYDENFLDYKKRAMFRKRDQSVFRERSRSPVYRQQQAELAERFLRAIEEERERERAEEYREKLRELWNRYQKEESNIEQELFSDNANDIETDYPTNYVEESRKRKRQRGEAEVAPSNWNEKRSMPLLPWLPAQRKKRFPVTKRSPKLTENEMAKVVSETSEKVSKDLQGIFGSIDGTKGSSDDEKKKRKRSSDDMMNHNHHDEKEHGEKIEKEKLSTAALHPEEKKRMVKRGHPSDEGDSGEDEDTSGEYEGEDKNSKEDDDDRRKKKKRATKKNIHESHHTEKEHGEKITKEKVPSVAVHPEEKKRLVKRSDSSEEDDGPTPEGHDSAADYSEEDDDDDRRKKKKREAKEIVDSNIGDLIDKKSVKKKSVEWSKIFGYDRKKKSIMYNPFRYSDQQDRRKKRNDDDEYEDPVEYNDEDYEDSDKRKRSSVGEDRLNVMDRKLKTIENLIVEDASKAYRHQNENLSPLEMKNVQKQLADRLATAYSLEKMRKAIGKLRASMAFQKGLEGNRLEKDDENDEEEKKRKAKRVAVKKEKAEFDNNDHEIESPMKKTAEDDKNNLDSDDDDKKKKKKKRSQKRNNEISGEPLMSEGYMGGMMFQKECPMLDSIERRCREIGLLSGDSHQNLLEACGEHQLCYLCGDSRTQCDFKYQYDANEICGYNTKCKYNAERSLEALRSFPIMKVGPRECIRNPCLYSALRSIEY